MKAAVLMIFVCLTIWAVTAEEEEPKTICIPGPCEGNNLITAQGHGLGAILPNGPHENIPEEQNNGTATEEPTD